MTYKDKLLKRQKETYKYISDLINCLFSSSSLISRWIEYVYLIYYINSRPRRLLLLKNCQFTRELYFFAPSITSNRVIWFIPLVCYLCLHWIVNICHLGTTHHVAYFWIWGFNFLGGHLRLFFTIDRWMIPLWVNTCSLHLSAINSGRIDRTRGRKEKIMSSLIGKLERA